MISLRTLLFCATLSCAASVSASPILGGLELGETDIVEYLKGLEAKNCQVSVKKAAEGFEYAEVPAACFGIPGSLVTFAGLEQIGEKKVVANIATIFFNKDFRSTVFEKYYQALTQKYGKPTSASLPFVGNKEVSWKSKDLVILLSEPHLDTVGQLHYMTPKLVDRQNQNEASRRAEEKKNIGAMI